MFSPELEDLIQATLEDGVLEDNEKAVLVKRAVREGVDLDELEIYINSLLQKRARELENEKNAVRKQIEKEKKEAFGRKCPNCGAQVPPLTLKCDCGYEFSTTKSVSSVQVLSEKIEKIMSEPFKNSNFPGSPEYKEDVRQRYQRVKDTINLFPVPNTKEDIIEFLAISAPNAKKIGGVWGTKSGRTLVIGIICLLFVLGMTLLDLSLGDGGELFAIGFCLGCIVFLSFILSSSNVNPTFIHNDLANAWRAKFNQVLMKGRSLRGDAEFTQQLDFYENRLNDK
jgi:hypothetical protein